MDVPFIWTVQRWWSRKNLWAFISKLYTPFGQLHVHVYITIKIQIAQAKWTKISRSLLLCVINFVTGYQAEINIPTFKTMSVFSNTLNGRDSWAQNVRVYLVPPWFRIANAISLRNSLSGSLSYKQDTQKFRHYKSNWSDHEECKLTLRTTCTRT